MHIEQGPSTNPPVVAAHEAETILEENRKLRETVNTITMDLREKNRLLEIEAALERVRTVAMAMKQPGDMLDVCRTISDQLVLLQLGELRNVQTIIIYESKGIYMNYEYYTRHHKQLVTEVDYFLHPAQVELVHEMQKGPEGYFTKSFSGEELQKWFEYQKTTPQFIDSYLQTATSINWYFYSVGPIGLGISTYAPLDNEEILLFKRFRNVFELAYRRYLDIEKAEAQAREAQIEAALERVRAKAMAMQQSTELGEAAILLYKELRLLGIAAFFNCGYVLIDEENNVQRAWMTNADGTIRESHEMPLSGDSIMDERYASWKRKVPVFCQKVEGKQLHDHLVFVTAQKNRDGGKNILPNIPDPTFFYCSHFSEGYLHILAYEEIPKESEHILSRFTNVFETAFRRFRDLQTAESQAKEAQIEAALERVRSHTMAMHSSNELLHVIKVVGEQLQQLGFPADAVSFITDNTEKGYNMWLASPGDVFLSKVYIPRIDDRTTRMYKEAVEKGEDYYTYVLTKEEKDRYFRNFFDNTDLKDTPEELKRPLFDAPGMSAAIAIMEAIILNVTNFRVIPYTEQHNNILKRFAFVFQQSYVRFLDLQKAEAQAREAQIEASLERVRGRAMAMQNSEELKPLIGSMFTELTKLDIVMIGCVIIIFDPATNASKWWMVNAGAPADPLSFYIPYHTNHPYQAFLKGWQEKVVRWVYDLKGTEKKNWDNFLFNDTELADIPAQVQSAMRAPERILLSTSFNTFGCLNVGTVEPLRDDQFDILLRFAKVFDLTYTRFNDLQQAEAQAREAQIEAALERVRAKVMAMNSSKDLNDASLVFGEQLRALGIHWLFSYFWLIEEGKDENTFWITWPDKKTSTTTYSLAEADESFRECIVAWQRQDKIHSSYVPVQDVQAWLDTFERITVDAGGEAVKVMRADNFKNGVYYYDAMIKFGSFGILINRPISEEEKNIQSRFAVEFERAYTRFLDLQKAEAQTREAQIETALERVRSRTMGMHKSEDLKEVIQVVYDQFVHLHIHVEHAGFIMDYKARDDMHIWLADKHAVPFQVNIPYFDCAHWNSFNDAKEKGRNFFANYLSFEEKNRFYRDLFKLIPGVPEETLEYYFNCPGLAISTVLLENVGLYIENFTGIPYSDEENKILMRFGKVFQQTYTRFLDLQKAEAQAREAQIEAAVERVRAKALAMHKSEDLHGVVVALKHQLNGLKIENVTAVSMYLEQDDGRIRGLDLSGVSEVDDGNEAFKMDVVFRLEDTDPDLWIRRIWNTNEDYFVLEADEADFERIIKWLYTLDPAEAAVAEKVIQENGINKAWLPTVKLQKGKLNIDLLQPPTLEVKSILLKMGAAFDLAYKRYLDLQNAEAQTREAQIEASLERVRSKAMSMHSSQDLADTIGVFYRELHSFSITPRRCGVGLLNKETRVCELFTWNTTDNGESLELVGKIKMEGHPVLENVYNNWLTQTEYHPVLRGNEIPAYYKLLRPQMSFPDYGKDEVQFGYFFFFKEGGVYAWTNNEMKEDELNIYRRFNSVLSLTYKRYKDLQLAEAHAIQAEKDLLEIKAARMKAEEALVELKTTQQQLIQSEKMASLGELTAGIAHEIQNPLNFVNNFSELNLELLSEVKEELRQGNVPDALAITEDIERNLEKVAHHGKRADAIVKGMLQHSRKTTGEKESIDINALVDEYIRLSYHGLRAKDKSFNTIIETHFDPSVGQVEIVGQDIGRVLLNLLNNAFYAVNEKKKAINDWYEPLVQVSTNRSNSTIEIKVKDNGIGIPEKVLDKIYQPFFTTKPTGEGTGLGLSLSYDIITKGHGGEMKVVTKEGEFTEFNISLPVL